MRAKPRRIEAQEQESLVEWFRLQYPELVLFAIPNGLIRNAIQGALNVRQGLVKGMPDLMLAKPVPPYGGLFIELKRPSYYMVSQGKVSIEQRDMINRLNQAGYLAVVCYGWVEGQKVIQDYLSGCL